MRWIGMVIGFPREQVDEASAEAIDNCPHGHQRASDGPAVRRSRRRLPRECAPLQGTPGAIL
jgi:hypothetical protein